MCVVGFLPRAESNTASTKSSTKPEGFVAYFETWEDSKVWDAAASWIAVGE